MPISDSIVAILNSLGKVSGTGFVAGERLILTCAHVVQAAGAGKGQSVQVRFQCNNETRDAQVDALSWRDANQEDIAVLLLDSDLPPQAVPLIPGSPAAIRLNGPFISFGYPIPGSSIGINEHGIITGVTNDRGFPLLQLSSPEIAQGSSGGPIYDEILHLYLGMITATYVPGQDLKNRDTAFATPVDVILQAHPPLAAAPKPVQTNPFYIGGAVPTERFIGRQSTLTFIRSRLGSTPMQSVSITGERRIGKSSVLCYIRDHPTAICNPPPVVIYLDLMRAYAHTRAGFMKYLRLQITEAIKASPWPESKDADLETLSFTLEELSDSGIRLIVCLDEVEQLTKRREQFDEVLEELRGAGQLGLVGLLTASARTLADLCQNHSISSPFYNIFVQDTLGLFSKAEWVSWLQGCLPGLPEINLQEIENIAGGHPCFTQTAARFLWDALHGIIEQDWKQRTLLEIQPHWKALWDHLDDKQREAMRVTAGLPGQPPGPPMIDYLQRRGLLRSGQPFSPAFGDWIRSI